MATIINPAKWHLSRLIPLASAAALMIAAWFLAGYEPLFRVQNQAIVPLAFTPQGDVLAAITLEIGFGLCAKDGAIRFLDSRNGTEVEPPLPTLPVPLQGNPAMARVEIVLTEFSADAKFLAVLQKIYGPVPADELELVVFERSTRARVAALPIPWRQNRGDTANRLFSPDARFLTWCAGNWVQPRSWVVVWDLERRQERFSIASSTYPVVSPDSRLLATVADPRGKKYGEKLSLKLWDTSSGALRQTLALAGTSTGWRPWPSFSPDGRLLAVNSRQDSGRQIVEVFATATGARVFEQDAWSPHLLADGKTLVTVKNSTVQLWDVETWKWKGGCEFKLGTHWENGGEITPEPVPVPGKSMVLVSDYYPSAALPYLRWLGDILRLNAFGAHQVTVIDGTSGRRQSVVLHDYPVSAAFSCDGSRVALSYGSSWSVWEIPPHKSLVPVLYATLVVVVYVGFSLVYKLLRRYTVTKVPMGTRSSPAVLS